MEQFLKVKDNENLLRDSSTGLLVNLDTIERNAIIKKRLVARSAKQEIDKQNAEINNIKTELGEIKELLLSLIQSKT